MDLIPQLVTRNPALCEPGPARAGCGGGKARLVRFPGDEPVRDEREPGRSLRD